MQNMVSTTGKGRPAHEDGRCLAGCGDLDVSKIQCVKMASAMVEATKNDATYIPSKLLDYLTSITLDVDAYTALRGCTVGEKCDWIVGKLKERLQSGQYWVCLKVFSLVRELLCRGSNAFVTSLHTHGMDMLDYTAVITLIRATPQTNLSGDPLPCTIQPSENLCMNAKGAAKGAAKAEPMKKACALFPCPSATAATVREPTAPRPPTCDAGPVAKGGALRHSDPAPPPVDRSQKQEEFMWTFLGYLEALCQYRRHHPYVDVARGRLHAHGGSVPDSMVELKTLLGDTLELLKSIAISDPRVPVNCLLTMTVVRKRMNDARILYSISCLILLKMLEQLFVQASLCMSAWEERFTAEGKLRRQQQQQQQQQQSTLASAILASKGAASSKDSSSERDTMERLVNGEVTEQSLRSALIDIFARWYHAIFQFDRTVQMLMDFCEALEHNSGETYLVASHLHHIPPPALDAVRELLRNARDQKEAMQCDALEECDLTTPLQVTNAHKDSLPRSGSGVSLERACSHLCGSFAKEDAEAHLEAVRRTWSLQVSALRQIFEKEGEAPPMLDSLQAVLDNFINAQKEQMSQQQSRQISSMTTGLSSSGLRNSTDSGSSTDHSDLQLEGAMAGNERNPTSPDERAKPRVAGGASTDDDSDSLAGRTLSRVFVEEGSKGDLRSTGTFILRRRSAQASPGGSGAVGRARGSALGGRQISDSDVIPLTEEMQRTDDSIQELLRADDVVVVCNEAYSWHDTVKLTDRFQIISGVSPLGQGTYGKVYRAWDELVGCYLAAKELPLDEAKQRHSAVREALKEYTMLTELVHPNIVRVVSFMVVGKTGRIFMEWMPSGSLQDVLRFSLRGALGEHVVSRYAYDALQGLAYLHSRGVLHRDVKPGNMLLGADGTVKLTDFGTSSVLTQGKHTMESTVITGTAPYMAPEAVQGLYSTASDIWSFGCSILELVTGKAPWSDPVTGARMDAVPLLFRIGSLSHTEGKTGSDRPNSYIVAESDPEADVEKPGVFVVSDHLADFLNKVFVVDRRARPTAEQLLDHPFIQVHYESREERRRALER